MSNMRSLEPTDEDRDEGKDVRKGRKEGSRRVVNRRFLSCLSVIGSVRKV